MQFSQQLVSQCSSEPKNKKCAHAPCRKIARQVAGGVIHCAAHSNETSIIFDTFINFSVIPPEICKINKRGCQNKLGRVGGGGGCLQKSRKK